MQRADLAELRRNMMLVLKQEWSISSLAEEWHLFCPIASNFQIIQIMNKSVCRFASKPPIEPILISTEASCMGPLQLFQIGGGSLQRGQALPCAPTSVLKGLPTSMLFQHPPQNLIPMIWGTTCSNCRKEQRNLKIGPSGACVAPPADVFFGQLANSPMLKLSMRVLMSFLTSHNMYFMLDPTLSGTVQKGLTNLLLVHRDTWNDRVTCSHVHSWSQPRSRALEVST